MVTAEPCVTMHWNLLTALKGVYDLAWKLWAAKLVSIACICARTRKQLINVMRRAYIDITHCEF
jgi:hypothetical protein